VDGLLAGAGGQRAGAQRDQVILVALLALVCLACWGYSVQMALQMSAGAMAMGEHAHHHHAATSAQGPPFLMWAVMMAGMMVPSEAAFLLRLLRLRQAAGAARSLAAATAFLAGYLAVWTLFSFGAAGLQTALQARGLLDDRLASTDARLSALLLAMAGAAQLSPLKRRCLERCHTPDPALGAASPLGAALAGAGQGWTSLASCGALMLVPFVAGAMDLLPMFALTAFLVVEALAPKRLRLSEAAGAALFLWAAWALACMS
jgi:predicted metal-binding membrane protein